MNHSVAPSVLLIGFSVDLLNWRICWFVILLVYFTHVVIL